MVFAIIIEIGGLAIRLKINLLAWHLAAHYIKSGLGPGEFNIILGPFGLCLKWNW